MFRRAKFSVLFTLAGVLTAAAAPLNPELKNTMFQPGGSPAAITTKATVLKPASASFWSKLKFWRGADKVEKITPGPQPAVQVEMNRFAFKKASDAPAPQPDVKTAGSGR
jgi:hypothetical protein